MFFTIAAVLSADMIARTKSGFRDSISPSVPHAPGDLSAHSVLSPGVPGGIIGSRTVDKVSSSRTQYRLCLDNHNLHPSLENANRLYLICI